MAFKKSIGWRGFEAEYWAITQIVWQKGIDQTTVNISPYANRAARMVSPINFIAEETKTFYFPGTLNQGELYTAIKALPDSFFSDAEDV